MEAWELVRHDISHPQRPSRPHPDVWACVPLNPPSIYAKGFHYLFGQAKHPSSSLASNVLTDRLWGNFDIGPA